MFPVVQVSADDGRAFLSVPNNEVPALIAALSRANIAHAVRGSSGGETVIELDSTADVLEIDDVLTQIYPNG